MEIFKKYEYFPTYKDIKMNRCLKENYIPIASSLFRGNEKKYLMECIETNWISSLGRFVSLFETNFSKFIGNRYSLTCSSGTSAIHLALLSTGIKENDEIIVPSFTFIATVNAILYCGAKPVFADIDPVLWCIDPAEVRKKISRKTKAILVVHIYGNPAEMGELQKIAKEEGLFLIEDCAEALGAKYNNKYVGSFSDMSCFSFFGNKVITCGEGGMVSSNNSDLIEKAKIYRDHGMDPQRRYHHIVNGYNYRMTNLQAAVGLAQLEKIQSYLKERRRVFEEYFKRLQEVDDIILPFKGDKIRKPINW
ncbi:MAG: DegT/DnrJ/EryC1/StrS family aminotransferase, partial [Elusimicrobiota bacterium]